MYWKCVQTDDFQTDEFIRNNGGQAACVGQERAATPLLRSGSRDDCLLPLA